MSSPQETSESKTNRKSRRRGPPMLGILLVALGTLLLLHTTDVLPWTVWFVLWQFWPVLLIVAGVNLFVGHRAPWVAGVLVALILAGSVGGAYALSETTSGDLAERYVATLAGAERADINIDFGAGSLIIESLPEGSPDLIDAKYFGRRGKTNIRRSGDTAIVDSIWTGITFSVALITSVGNYDCLLLRGLPLVSMAAQRRWMLIFERSK